MTETTLCFPRRTRESASGSVEEVLLIEKRRGLGDGLYNGPGGKLETGETPRECAVRETREEVGLEIDPTDLEKAGELTFLLDGERHSVCHVFRTRSFSGEPTTTAEARPTWTRVDDVPYDQMWDDDHRWLPGVLEGETVVGDFHFEGGKPLDEAEFVEYDLEWNVSLDE
ncbi:8-oxo-dGTP diphosphatase [Natronorubrum daqingense]|uniref:Oxidized purine nucleoside triphosphate hydrolase n=1 Tax=Natronorubrum daqingense TaxID=588898 RepID=A0A1N7CQA9_9EURY|nr:8-oxo-dGTP diphosphatase [Natronorubrum daqingense]APX97008.1 NUDIX hydrolase [Natronorubrum daqingense]SIR65730.1 8-oxo-dGTP diphosphatase [Natronorubrum daqingense]